MKYVSSIIFATAVLLVGCNKSPQPSSAAGSPSKKITIALMPKSKGNAYFISCKQGADKAAKELGVELIFDGPTDPDPAKPLPFIAPPAGRITVCPERQPSWLSCPLGPSRHGAPHATPAPW